LRHNQTAVDQAVVTSAAVRGKRQIGAVHHFCSGRIVQFQLDRFKRAIEVVIVTGSASTPSVAGVVSLACSAVSLP
jgi:hypothetical protein